MGYEDPEYPPIWQPPELSLTLLLPPELRLPPEP